MRRKRRRKDQPENPEHRIMIMERLTTPYVWCLHCERAYPREKIRWDSQLGLYMCPYEGCDGDALTDAWRYEEIRRDAHPEWPEVPEEGVVYSMYGNKKED